MGNAIESPAVLNEFAAIMAGEVDNWVMVYELSENGQGSIVIRGGGSAAARIGLLNVAGEYMFGNVTTSDADEADE